MHHDPGAGDVQCSPEVPPAVRLALQGPAGKWRRAGLNPDRGDFCDCLATFGVKSVDRRLIYEEFVACDTFLF